MEERGKKGGRKRAKRGERRYLLVKRPRKSKLLQDKEEPGVDLGFFTD